MLVLPPPLPSWHPTALRDGVVALNAADPAVFAVLGDGTVVRSGCGGEAWEAYAGRLPEPLAPTAALATPTGFVLGTTDGVYRRASGGAWRWFGEGLPAGTVVLALAAAGPVFFAGTLRAGVFCSTAGRRWEAGSTGLPHRGAGLEVSAFAIGAGGILACHPYGLSRTVGAGRRWEPAGDVRPAPGALLTAGSDVVAETGGRLYRSAGGADWEEVHDGRGRCGPLGLAGAGGGDLFATALDSGGLFRSGDGGATWVPFSEGLPPGCFPVTRVVMAAGFLLVGVEGAGVWRRQAVLVRPAEPAPVLVELATEPNPFSDATTIAFTLAAAADVLLTVHDLLDAEVARVAEAPFSAGSHRVRFDARALPEGLYRCRLTAGGRGRSRPMLLLR